MGCHMICRAGRKVPGLRATTPGDTKDYTESVPVKNLVPTKDDLARFYEVYEFKVNLVN